MATETNFQIGWLQERFDFDSQARNQVVEAACVNFFAQKNTIHIVDIGSGTASNFLYLSNRFPQNQYWTFIELNLDLIQAAKTNIEHFAQSNDYTLTEKEEIYFLKKQDKEISIQIKSVSFLDLSKAVDLKIVDLVCAGAVFDLLNVPMFEEMATSLLANEVALLATINYQGLLFKPAAVEDKKYIDYFEAHMTRPQHFGQAMGPSCTKHMLDFYRSKKINTVVGKSNWQIQTSDLSMRNYLLNYLEEGIEAMLSSMDEKMAFQDWFKQKKALLNLPAYSLIVAHQDIFAPPSKL